MAPAASGGTSATASAKSTMSPGVASRETKNSAFLPSTLKSGCATASAYNALRCSVRCAAPVSARGPGIGVEP
jgi:hypothetical protein